MQTSNPVARPANWRSLAANVLAALALATLLNAWIFMDFRGELDQRLAKGWLPQPDGWVIGAVWTILFGLMGFARWRLKSSGGIAADHAARAVAALILVCAAYPIYTLGLQDGEIGLIGNFVTLAVAGLAWNLTARVDRTAAAVPALVMAWLCFASLLILDQNGWIR